MLGPTVAVLDARIAHPAPKLTDPFYGTTEWKSLVAKLIAERGRRCERCGATGGMIYADHIVEIKDGGARLDPANIQLLDSRCHGQKTKDEQKRRAAGTA